MSPELSIIIPCYNCAPTLEEAVESCFRQGLERFEIVMVDDGSSDGTKEVMRSLAGRHPEIRLVFHETNKGGGAARNTAVENSASDVIFCLDSDDILADGMLRKMVDLQKEKQCDGVGISTSKKFQGKHGANVVSVDSFGYVGQTIPFDSLFQKKRVLCPLYSTFLFTKRAFAVTGGYPTTHGFDTQGFAWRFLGNGLTAYACPDTTYLHRVNFHESYYIREYNSGRVNRNWQEIIEEFLFLLSPDAQRIVMESDRIAYGKNLMDEVSSVPQASAKHVGERLKNNSRKLYVEHLESKSRKDLSDADLYWLGCFRMGEGSHAEALSIFTELKAKRPNARQVRVKLALARKALAGATQKELRQLGDRLSGVTNKRSLRGIVRRVTGKLERKTSVARSAVQERGWRPRLLLGLLWLEIRKGFRAGFDTTDESSDLPDIDVVIPTVTKDFDLLRSSVESLSLLRAKINRVHIIGPNSAVLEEFCEKNGYAFVPEDALLPGVKKSIRYVIDDMDLSGWILQQLLKFKAADIVESEKYFVIDSDTVLTRQHSFTRGGKSVFLESAEWHAPYFEAFEKIFGARARNSTSSICHMMMFDAKRVLEMRKEVEERHGAAWEKAILANLDYSKRSCFSEFETYSNWMALRHPREITRIPFYNRSLPRSEFERAKNDFAGHSGKAKSLSFHSYDVPRITTTNEK